MARAFLAFTLVLGFSSAVAAAEPGPEPVTTYRLDNGLEVVLAPDRRVPKVVMNVRYSVGSMNEPAGRSGFAHLFEHLMFSGTEAYPDVFGAHSALGNEINAWTMEDGTVYYVEGLSSSLPMILSLEADRMANLGGNVDQRELDLQRSVVKNEMRQNVLDQAGSSAWEAFWSGLFPKPHPYSRTVIGSIADLDSASLDDVHGFFNTYYVPNNAVLVLTGDFEISDARDLVAQTFGLVPRGADVPRASGESQPARIRLDMQDRVPAPVVVAGYTGPAVQAAENGALLIAADLIGNSEIGALRNRLVNEKGVATYASAYWTPGLLGGRFTIEAGAAEGVTAEALETELHAAIADFLAKPVADTDVERSRRGILLADRIGTESLKDRTNSLAFQVDMYGKVTYGLGDDPTVANVTAADVQQALRDVVDPAKESVLILRPGPRGGYPAVLTDSSGVPTAFTAEDRPAIAIPKLAPREPSVAGLPEKQVATLSNGISVVHYQMPTAPVTYIAATAKGGWSNAPQGKEGLISMAVGMAYRGAADRSYDAFAKAAKDIGASIGSRADSMATAVTLSVPADALDGGVTLLADAVLRPRFDAQEWAISVAETRDWLNRREADLPGVADRVATAALYPQAEGKAGPDWSLPALSAMSRDDARTAFAHLFRPSGTTFYSVGPTPVAAVAASLEKAFGGWKDDGAALVAEPLEPAHFSAGRTVLVVPEPGASQSALYVVRPAPGLDEPLRNESAAVSRLLGGDFNSRLNSVIREEKGYSYGVSSYLMAVGRKGSGLVVATTVQRDSTGPALEEVLKGFAGMATVPVSADELNRTTTLYLQTLAGEAETSSGLFGDLMAAIGGGSTLEESHAWREAKTKLDLATVNNQAKAMSPLDPALIVVAGDPEVVMPQLAAIGLDAKLVERDTPTGIDRAPDLTDSAAPDGNISTLSPVGQAGRSARDGRSTRSIHACDGDDGNAQTCAAGAHQE